MNAWRRLSLVAMMVLLIFVVLVLWTTLGRIPISSGGHAGKPVPVSSR